MLKLLLATLLLSCTRSLATHTKYKAYDTNRVIYVLEHADMDSLLDFIEAELNGDINAPVNF